MKNYAVLFLAWGDKFIEEVHSCIERSPAIQNYEKILITDQDTLVGDYQHHFKEIIRANFKTEGLLRKTEMVNFLPHGYDCFLFLDSDTVVIEDISLGFQKAEQFGIAVSPAPHYSLDYFWGFGQIMALEGVPCQGQLQYNTGVIFLKNCEMVGVVFEKWKELGLKHQNFKNDQPFFTLAMEKVGFNPYTLSISYNYRGFGDAISGLVRVWHSHDKMPEMINQFKEAWPPRKAWPSKIEFQEDSNFSKTLHSNSDYSSVLPFVRTMDKGFIKIFDQSFHMDRRSLWNIVQHIQNRNNMVEVGSLAGFSTRFFAYFFKKVYSVDPYLSGYDPDDLNSNDYRLAIARDAFKIRFCDDFKVQQINEESSVASTRFKDNSLDFVYIDAAHDYDSVKSDIETWIVKIKPGGMMAGDDYKWPGLSRAVGEFFPYHQVIGGRWLAQIS